MLWEWNEMNIGIESYVEADFIGWLKPNGIELGI